MAVRTRPGSLAGTSVGAAGVAQAAAPTRRPLDASQVLAAFGGRIEPVRPTLLYRLWILIVAAVMVLLPVAYIAIIGLVAMAVIWHAVHNVSIFQHVRGANAVKIAAVVYAAPLIAGGVVVALLIKPLFARPARGPRARVLDPGEEPLLYAFVDGVCASVGAPRPARIEVNCQVNASAHRAGGLLGVLGGKLVLTIGLPFAAGVSLKQFAGVLAHEFGHFSQGAGMRLSALIRRINYWFARVVYERDEWDASLERWSSNGEWLVMLVVAVAKLAVWLTRRVLWVLMMFGHTVSGFLSRQMEFDADRYEARMVGGACFAETMWRFREMSLAESGAHADLSSSWREHRLPDNFPKLVMANIPQVPQEVLAQFRHQMETAAGGLFDTHPCDKDRIARARREAPGDGIFHLEGPATDVFRDFDALAKAASFEMYRESLGPSLSREQLYDVSELVETQAAAQEGSQAAERFFLKALDVVRRLPMPAAYPSAPADLSATRRSLAEAREAQQSAREFYVTTSQRFRELEGRLENAELALALLKADVKIQASDFGLKAATEASAESARNQAAADLQRLEESEPADPFARAATGRLAAALGLLETDEIAGRVPDGPARRAEAHALYPCARHLAERVMPQLYRMARSRAVLLRAVQVYEAGKNPKDQRRINAVLRTAADLRDVLEETRWKVGDGIAYPFEHAQEGIALGAFAFSAVVPGKQDIGGLVEVSGEVLQRLAGLYYRTLGRLALAAEAVEQVLGLPPIVVEDTATPSAAVPG